MKKSFAVVITLVFFSFAIYCCALASNNNTELFKATAFSSASFNSQRELLEKFPKNDQAIKQAHPFFEEFILRKKGLPSELAVNKWSQTEVEVLIGWPISDKRYQANLPSRRPENAEKVKQLSSLIIESIKDVDELDHIKLKHILDDSTGHEKSIRIIPVNSLYPESSKEKIQGSEGYMLRSAPWYPAINFLGKTLFTQNAKTGVEGFFLANEKNEIQFAACFIVWSRTNLEIKNAISECVIRSLGIPESPTSARKMSIEELKQSQRLLYCPAVKSAMTKLEAVKTVENKCKG